MSTLKHAAKNVAPVLSVAVLMLYGSTALAQNAAHTCKPAQVIPLDEMPWHWADASGTPLILRGLPPGPHKVLIELVDANHQPVDKGSVTFDVPTLPR